MLPKPVKPKVSKLKPSPISTHLVSLVPVMLVCLLLFTVRPTIQGQTNIKRARGQGREILKLIKKDIQKHYYDSTFHGLDLLSPA